MKTLLLFAALTAVAVPVAARADCAGDIESVKTRLARETDPQVKAAVKKQLQQAEMQKKGSESECRNAVTRAWRAFTPPPTPVVKKDETLPDPRRR